MVLTRLIENTYPLIYASSGTTSPLNSTVIDMDGFEGLLALAAATVTSTAQHLKVQVGTASGSLSDTTGRVEHNIVGTLAMDVFRPVARYVKVSFTASGGSAPARSLAVIRYGPRSAPVSFSSADVSTGSLTLGSPGTGTATG